MKSKPEKFVWSEGQIIISQCVRCKHAESDNACAAFPFGIPQAILDNEHDHKSPYPGDGGIRFELAGE